jgi:hypothetical protein
MEEKNEKEIPKKNVRFKIVESKRSKKSDFISVVLGQLVDESEFVTWLFNHQDGGFFWGHYFSDYTSAKKDFINRD